MKCKTCEGYGYTEKEAGLIQVKCQDCDGTGEVDREDTEPTFTGLVFQLTGKRTDEYSIDELWMMAKKAAIPSFQFPHLIKMPCGKVKRLDNASDVLNLPVENIPCLCGNPNHYIVKFIDNCEVPDDNSRSNDNSRYVGGDRSSKRAEPDNQPVGSGDTSQPKQHQKPKAKKKAGKRTS